MKKFLTKQNIFFIVSVLGLIAADIITKIVFNGKNITLIGGFLSVTSTYNTGAAFGFLSGNVIFFIIFSSLVLAVAVFLHIKNKQKTKLYYISAALIFAGALGNFIDRIFLHYVRDFINFHFFPAIFNFADSFLTIGVVLLAVYIIFFYKSTSREL